MEIQGKEVDVDTLVHDLNLDAQFLKKRKNGLVLSDYQIEVLRQNGIHYENYTNLSSLLFDLNELEEDPELETVIADLQELHYYNETHK